MKTELLPSGAGKTIWVAGDHYTIKTSGTDTGGAFALVEARVPPGGGPPPHRHTREDEAFYLLEGELEFHADGQSFRAGPGAWITLAKGSLHRFRNLSDRDARLLILVAPAGLEQFFLEVGTPGDGPPTAFGPDELQRMLAAAPRYGLEIQKPDSHA